MIWLRLIWWVFWRGLLCGAIQGLLFGTLIALIYGMFYGVIIGTLLGAVLGLINGLSLAVITRSYFNPPRNPDRFLRSIRWTATPINMLVVFACAFLFVSIVAIIPALIAAFDVYHFSFGFAEYADSQLTQLPLASHQRILIPLSENKS
jgi:hypothetical protein